jgi:NADH-quinone oxidoreductase subunit C
MAPGPKEWVKVPSMIGVWPGAEPFESELGPLFGIEFTGAPTERGVRKNFGNFSGFPLRKGFEWHGEIDP